MNGKIVKYYYSEKNNQSKITIPRSMAEGLNWDNKDEINIVIKTVDGQLGLFLFKKGNQDWYYFLWLSNHPKINKKKEREKKVPFLRELSFSERENANTISVKYLHLYSENYLDFLF